MRSLGLAVAGCCLLVAGCQTPRPIPPPIPMSRAIGVVESNRKSISSGLRARGSASGHFLDGRGVRRHYNLEAKLLVRPPHSLRFVLEHVLAGDELRVGMNEAKWWIWVRHPKEQELEGDRDDGGVYVNGNVPVRADQFMEALGLNPLPETGVVQRVTAQHQQLIFVAVDQGRQFIEKEYWLDRYEPRLIRRIVFRDSDGRITLSSELDKYARLGGRGPLLPHRLRLTWPGQDAEMVFDIHRWREDASLTPDHPAFVAPSDRRAWAD